MMRRFMALGLAAAVAVALTTGSAAADKPDYSGSYAKANSSGAQTKARITLNQEKDGEWTVRLVGQRLPFDVEALAVTTVGADGFPFLHSVCDLDPMHRRHSCTVRNFDFERYQTGAVPVWAVLMQADLATGGQIPAISIPLEQG